MKLFKRKPREPMSQRARNRLGAFIGVLALAFTALLGVPAAQAATMSSCYIAAAGPDHHMGWRHGHIVASVDYNWVEEVFFGYRDGYRFFGTTDASKIDTRPYWIAGC
jgi:hypothetical protein